MTAVVAKIIVELSDEAEGDYLAALLNAGIGNDDPAKGPISITKVQFFKSEKITPPWTFTPVKSKIESTGKCT
jgi:hypothetical protein